MNTTEQTKDDGVIMTLREFDADAYGAKVSLREEVKNGERLYSIVILNDQEGADPVVDIIDFPFSSMTLEVAELFASVASKAHIAHVLSCPDDHFEIQMGVQALKTERLRHVRRFAQGDLNTLRFDLSEGNATMEEAQAAADRFQSAKVEEIEAEKALRRIYCRREFEKMQDLRSDAGLEALTDEEREKYIESHESYASAFG